MHVETDDYLTADQAAEALGIARRSVYYYESYVDGFPQAVRIGRTPMWNRKEIEAWRAAHPSRKRADTPEPAKREGKKAAPRKAAPKPAPVDLEPGNEPAHELVSEPFEDPA